MKNNKSTLGLIFTSTHNEKMNKLTLEIPIGALPFGGRYRLIDIMLSNFANDHVNEVGVITKNNYQIILKHLGSGKEWDLASKKGGLSVLPPLSQNAMKDVYKGKLDAMRGVLSYIKASQAEYVILADSDVIINFVNYDAILAKHVETGADITVIYHSQEVGEEDYIYSTILEVDESGRITDAELAINKSSENKVSLNMYFMRRDYLVSLLTDDRNKRLSSFEKDIILKKHEQLKIYGFAYNGYARRINSVKNYFDANMELLNKEIRETVFSPNNRKIYTKVHDEVPVKYGSSSQNANSLVADGAIIEGIVSDSVIFRRAKIAKNAVVKNSILMPGAIVDEGAAIEYCIVQDGAHIQKGHQLKGSLESPMCIMND